MDFGIIGYGSFGKLCAEVLSQHGKVIVYDQKEIDSSSLPENVLSDSFNAVSRCKVVIICSGINTLQQICQDLKAKVSKDTIVVEVCATKIKSSEIIEDVLGETCQILSVHALFGPQTVENGNVRGKKIVYLPIKLADSSKIERFIAEKLELELIKITAEEHDQQMAWVHGLTFFVGRGLLDLEPPKSQLTTGYYQKILELVELENKHSVELFKEVEQANPYAKNVRQKFLDTLKKIDEGLEK